MKPILNLDNAIKLTINWYKSFSLKVKIKQKILEEIKYLKTIRKYMKVVILAGGLGSRLSEYTKLIPKPMVKILRVP